MRERRPRATVMGTAAGTTFGLIVACCAIASMDSAGYCGTQAPTPPIVPAVERLSSDSSMSPVALGRVLTQELNCVACHLRGSTRGKQAPVLTDVAGRVRPDYMRRFIARPGVVKPGTTMPDLFAGDSAAVRDSASTALTHYLMRLSDRRPPREYAPTGGRRRGEELYHETGCAACHDPQEAPATPLPTSAPLGDLASRYTQASLAAFLHDPLRARPSGRMPNLNLSMPEARDTAAYLLRPGAERPGIRYHYYPGEWHEFPEFDRIEPEVSGSTKAITASLGRGGHWYGLRFTGTLTLERSGIYRFYVASGDTSRLTVDGERVLEQRGEGALTWEQETIELAAGRHDVAVDFMARRHEADLGYSPVAEGAEPEEFDPDGGWDEDSWNEPKRIGEPGEFEDYDVDGEDTRPELFVEFEGPGITRRAIEPALLAATPGRDRAPSDFVVDPELAGQGRRLFVTKGCAACHEAVESGVRVESHLSAPRLLGLRGGGCLSDTVPNAPDFRLTRPQAEAIRAYLDAPMLPALTTEADAASKASATPIPHAMLTFNCYACHSRDGIGGVERARDAYFRTTQREVGDEARIPPPLDGVGAKLNEEWLAHVVSDGAKDRPYMLTRMPSFGAENARELAAWFADADHIEPLPHISVDEAAAKKAGRDMVGSKGFTCIACHPFGRYEATGLQSMDMTLMTARLREDWFRRYVADPPRYRGVTRMPASWPLDEPSYLAGVLDGDTAKQIQAIWLYLTDGADAKTPAGLGEQFLELIPEDEAIIYRNFIEGAGPRAIGVGFPEGVHIAFDANDARLALMWRGGFIDAGRHWTGRGEGFQPPLGHDVRAFAEGVPLARLWSPDAPWPGGSGKEFGVVFGGYRLTPDHRPTFMYRFDGLTVEDTPSPAPAGGEAGLSRRLAFGGSSGPGVWFRAARGSITRTPDGAYEFSGMRMRIETTGPAPVLRSRDGVDEVLVPVSPSTTLTQTFHFVGGYTPPDHPARGGADDEG